MTLRRRLTWWSAGLMICGLLLLLGFAYFEFIHEHAEYLLGDWTPAKHAAFLHSVKEVGLFAGLPAALLGLCGIWWLVYIRRALRPLEQLTTAAERIHMENLAEALPRSGNDDEIDRLAAVLTDANRRINEGVQRVREFTLHASHELKTPLTVMRAGLESSLREENLSPAQREQLVDRLAELDRLARIVEGLTFLAKADAQLIENTRQTLRLDELILGAFEDAQSLAHPRDIKVELRECTPVVVFGDRNRLRQLLLNMADNAVKYNVPGGRMSLSLTVSGGSAWVVVSNTGPGLAPEFQSRVFDRFFRGDLSHNDEIEGCGLGLAIARWIAEAHGGEISFVSDPGKLTTVSLRLPVAGEIPAESTCTPGFIGQPATPDDHLGGNI